MATTLLVKPKDHDNETLYEKVVYDPGPGTLSEGALFYGWIKKSNGTTADADDGMTIDEVVQKVMDLCG